LTCLTGFRIPMLMESRKNSQFVGYYLLSRNSFLLIK